MMKWVFAGMMLLGIALFAARGDGSGALNALAEGAGSAVELSITLAGSYMLWMGVMNIAREAGLIEKLAAAMKKPLRLLMPGAGEAAAPVTLNLAANFFGLGNAATPFGIEAMKKLDKGDGRATDDMAMFIALNSSAIELLPTSVIAVRTACGSAAPYDVVIPTFIASAAAAAAAVVSCKLLSKVFR